MGQILALQKPILPSADDTASRVKAILDAGTAENTRKAYRKDIEYFSAWHRATTGRLLLYPIPVPVVVRFIVDHLKIMPGMVETGLIEQGFKARIGQHSLSTVCRRIASLSVLHEARKLENPCRSAEVTTLLSKAKRAQAKEGGPQKKRAITRDILDLMLNTCGNSLIDKRDKALLLFGFSSGGRRRSEIASAKVETLTPVEGGYVYHIPMSKTDQEGRGQDVPVLGRAAIALDAWLEAARIEDGFIFRGVAKGGRITDRLSDKAVARIVKKRAEMVGLDPVQFGGHSLRSGFVTEAGRQGKTLADTMTLSGHKSMSTALKYHQSGAVVHNTAARLAD